MTNRVSTNSSLTNRRTHFTPVILIAIAWLTGFAGCANFQNLVPAGIGLDKKSSNKDSSVSIGARADAATQSARVSNPRAQEIRFDGQERLLGGGNCKAIPTSNLMKQIQELEEQNKIRSVAMLVQLHKRSARQLVLQQKGNRDSTLELIATTLDEGIPSKIWGDLQSEFSSRSSEASDWKSSISNLTTAENDLEKVESSIANLRSIANKFESPLLNIEVLRLNGELNVSGGNTAQAIESLVTAAELAAGQGDSSMAADLWLMSCEASQRMDQVEQARQCWRAALQSQVTSLHARGVSQPLPTIDPVFWEHASRLAHPGDKLPKELTLALAPWYSRMGIRTSESLSPETALWSAIAEYQLVTGQPHLASLSIKRAESQAPETSHPYLQIALARAMAAQGQQTVATTILGSVADSEIPGIRASALAVLGSIKLQAGAYEQGGKFLGEALAVENAEDWPGRLAAQADFANVRLILGKLDDALPALHSVQTEMLKHEKWQSLCHSLENEAAVLEIEGRKKEAREIRQRVAKIESRQL